MSATKVNKTSIELLLLVAALIVLLMSAVNIKEYLTPKKVLGIQVESVDDSKFWMEYLKNNPSYVPGWIEIGRMDKVAEIDPNYFLGTKD